MVIADRVQLIVRAYRNVPIKPRTGLTPYLSSSPPPLRHNSSCPKNRSVSFKKNDGCASESCLGESVLDIFKRNPSSYNFREVCLIFAHLNLYLHLELVRSTLMNYSIKIYGLPECPSRDLCLAVYFFFEEVFGIKCKFQLCVQLVEDDDPTVIGVVLDSRDLKKRILDKAECLDGTDIKIRCNDEIYWILNGFCS